MKLVDDFVEKMPLAEDDKKKVITAVGVGTGFVTTLFTRSVTLGAAAGTGAALLTSKYLKTLSGEAEISSELADAIAEAELIAADPASTSAEHTAAREKIERIQEATDTTVTAPASPGTGGPRVL